MAEASAFNLFDDETRERPFGYFRAIREQSPVSELFSTTTSWRARDGAIRAALPKPTAAVSG